MTDRLAILKSVLWALVGVLAVVTVARFTNGLGATTNLSDSAPWGLWIGFDVMGGVALAAGAFVIAVACQRGLHRFGSCHKYGGCLGEFNDLRRNRIMACKPLKAAF